ncbi:MAG: ferrous iron transport protein A [Candidatus Diapherotrites archaeon]|nr:ferrous iron transport protein A [Candidatus Diapherotrites archaeon]
MLVPLTHLKGKKAIVREIHGGVTAKQRLSDMGLLPGTQIKVLGNAPFKGPIRLEVKHSELVVGWGLASKIFVEEIV